MSQITLFCAYTLIYITRAKSDKDIQPKQSRRSAKATTTSHLLQSLPTASYRSSEADECIYVKPKDCKNHHISHCITTKLSPSVYTTFPERI